MKRLYVAYNGKLFDALLNEDWEKFESLTDLTGPQFLVNEIYWTLICLIIGIMVVGLINWKYKFGIINSILVLILTFGISATGIYSSGIINRYLNYFCGLFAEGYGMAFLIGGLIILFVGITILWKTIIMNKKHCTQQRV
ncbi:hypothetical protein GCM10009431_19030 [Gaetbulibacter jejuensis]|uniref:Uncharacterized protein n=2 Tax=Gaetbulibacter jejuensis TaxID=584607 RepID=A0ABN1JR92_9FLAO